LVYAEQELIEAIAAEQLACFTQGSCLGPVSVSPAIPEEVEDHRGGAGVA
jgi:hypothetical protein